MDGFVDYRFYIFVRTKHGCTKTIKMYNIAVAPCKRYESAGVLLSRVVAIVEHIWGGVFVVVVVSVLLDGKQAGYCWPTHIRNFLIKIKSVWWSLLWCKNRQQNGILVFIYGRYWFSRGVRTKFQVIVVGLAVTRFLWTQFVWP